MTYPHLSQLESYQNQAMKFIENAGPRELAYVVVLLFTYITVKHVWRDINGKEPNV